MTDKEKQIEEMAQGLIKKDNLCAKCVNIRESGCALSTISGSCNISEDYYKIAEDLILNSGYRKESEVVKDVLMEVLNIYLGQDCMLFRCNIKDLAEKHGVKLGGMK